MLIMYADCLIARCCPAALLLLLLLLLVLAEIGVDTSTVQRIDAPTRDIYVERTKDGDRVFAGFGLPSEQYCDCYLDEEKLPKEVLSVSDHWYELMKELIKEQSLAIVGIRRHTQSQANQVHSVAHCIAPGCIQHACRAYTVESFPLPWLSVQ